MNNTDGLEAEGVSSERNDVLWLNTLLDLKREPVGVRFLLDEVEYSESPVVESVNGLPYCTAVRNAGNNKGCKMTLKHFACLAAAKALGLMPTDNNINSGKRHRDLGVYADLGVSRSVIKNMVFCKQQCYGIEVMPLADFRHSNPDVVLIITNPYNAMRIIQGFAYHEGHLKNAQLSGMCAICQECTSYPFENDQVNISLMCSGTRCVAQWGKDELGIGIPYRKLDKIIKGILKTVNHMDQNKEKKMIDEKLRNKNLSDNLEIIYNKNYYTNTYGTIEQLGNRKKIKP